MLLVKRGAQPNEGRWSVPGGVLEVGETAESAVVRETREETQVLVRPRRVLSVETFIQSEEGRVRWHYVLIDFLCDYAEGEPGPGTDAANARFISLSELAEYDVTETALEAVRRAVAIRP